jgi:FkbM family methyltransferase
MLGPNFQELERLIPGDDFDLQAHLRNTLRLLRPQVVRSERKARFGAANKGGYVQLDDLKGVDAALSLGIRHGIVWDKMIADRGIAVYQFDCAADDPAPDDSRLAFSRKMIASKVEIGVDSLGSLVDRFDKKRERPNMLLKMDIGGSEWGIINAAGLDVTSRFSQIICTLHDFDKFTHLRWRQTCFRVLRKLLKSYAPVHVHADNRAGFAVIANVPVPKVLEVTFASRLLYDFDNSEEIFPGTLDKPCDPAQPDLFLGSFRFEAVNADGQPSRVWPAKPPISNAGQQAPTSSSIPDAWQARADAATERRARLTSFGPRAAGILVAADNGPMVVDAEDSSVSAILLARGTFADHEFNLARSLITPEGIVLVVGSHIGAHVVRLAKHCKELIAIEANPRTFAFLEANVRLQACKNVRLFNLAAGEKDGSISFLMNRDNSGGSKRQPINSQFFYVYDQPEVIEVECRKLDQLLPDDTQFDLVFMDIEGSEYFALQGMQSILARTKAISIEFLSHHIRDVAAADIDDFSALIAPHFNWMIVPERREFVSQSAMPDYMREMYTTGQNYDCVYFLKELDPDWLKQQGLPDPRV